MPITVYVANSSRSEIRRTPDSGIPKFIDSVLNCKSYEKGPTPAPQRDGVVISSGALLAKIKEILGGAKAAPI